MILYKEIKVFLLLALLVTSTGACQNQKKDSLPKPIGFVSDFENIFSTSQKNYLDSMIGAFQNKTTIQIAVVTVDTSMVTHNDFENYILKILNEWGVGQKEKNNGIVIGICRSYRLIRIENGYGIEKVLSNAETKTIIDTAFIPSFKKGQYFEGTVNGLKAVMNKLQ